LVIDKTENERITQIKWSKTSKNYETKLYGCYVIETTHKELTEKEI
jgi:hypothetical protein